MVTTIYIITAIVSFIGIVIFYFISNEVKNAESFSEHILISLVIAFFWPLCLLIGLWYQIKDGFKYIKKIIK